MNEQDERAVESMCLCGLDKEALCSAFPNFAREDILRVYERVKGITATGEEVKLSVNCS